MAGKLKESISFSVAGLALAFVLMLSPTQVVLAAKEKPPEISHDGLQLLPESRAATVYVKPDADFSVYNKVMILDCSVAFKKDWQRDYNRDHRSLSHRVSDRDMERMKGDMAELFKEVFVEEITEDGGYEVTDEPAADVLLVHPAIIDLVVTAPDLQSAGRTRTFVDSSGAATLFVELHDSVTGEILARAVDRKADRDHGRLEWSTRASNRADARRILRQWAGWLREGLDQVHGKGGG